MTDRDLDCDEFVELVTAYLEGELSPSEERRILDHLELCDGCSTYLEQIRMTVAALAELPVSDSLPDAGRQRLLEAFRNAL